MNEFRIGDIVTPDGDDTHHMKVVYISPRGLHVLANAEGYTFSKTKETLTLVARNSPFDAVQVAKSTWGTDLHLEAYPDTNDAYYLSFPANEDGLEQIRGSLREYQALEAEMLSYLNNKSAHNSEAARLYAVCTDSPTPWNELSSEEHKAWVEKLEAWNAEA